MNQTIHPNTSDLTPEEARFYISCLFDGYQKRKRKGTLYRHNDPVPRIIIETYYQYIDNPSFDTLFTTFKRKYIINESNAENVHSPAERKGLGIVYDYIQSYIPSNSLNIYLLFKIHQLLYSKVPFPEFGGKPRKDAVYLPGTGIDIVPWDEIASELQKLYVQSLPLFQKGIEIGETMDVSQMPQYIDDCIKLNCKIIKIHPFMDGNGRSSRALMNLMFKLVNIPPVYITLKERPEFEKAMKKAVNDEDYDDILTFYYYKICDSIVALDSAYNHLNEKDKVKKLGVHPGSNSKIDTKQ